MNRVIIAVTACLILTVYALPGSKSTTGSTQASVVHCVSLDELTALPSGTLVGIGKIQCYLPSLTVGEVKSADSSGLTLTKVVRQKPPYLSIRHRLGYPGRLMRHACAATESLAEDWIPMSEVHSVVIFTQFPPMSMRKARHP